MDTVKIYNLRELSRNSSKPRKGEFSVYLRHTNGKRTNNCITFCSNDEFVKQNKLFMSIAENTLTEEVFIIFNLSDSNGGVELSIGKNKDVSYRSKKVINFLLEKLKIDTSKDMNRIFKLSNNLSKATETLTYKVLTYRGGQDD